MYYKERPLGRIIWFVLIMLLGNMAMASFVLRELLRLGDGEPAEQLLLRRTS